MSYFYEHASHPLNFFSDPNVKLHILNGTINQEDSTYVIRQDRLAKAFVLTQACTHSSVAETAADMAAHLFIRSYQYWLDNVLKKIKNKDQDYQNTKIGQWLTTQMSTIHDYIANAAALLPDCAGMNTQLCGVIYSANCLWIIRVGNIKIHVFDRKTQRVKNFMPCFNQIEEGATGFQKIVPVLGVGNMPEPELVVHPLLKNQVFIFSSSNVSQNHIVPLLNQSLTSLFSMDENGYSCIKNGGVPVIFLEKQS